MAFWAGNILFTEITICFRIVLPVITDFHYVVIKWEPALLPFVRGIHRSTVNSPHKGQRHGPLMLSLICALNKRLSKQSWGWWFETPSCSLWRHCNANNKVNNGRWGLSKYQRPILLPCFIPAWIIDYIRYEGKCEEMAYKFSNFYGATVKIWYLYRINQFPCACLSTLKFMFIYVWKRGPLESYYVALLWH